MQNDVLAAVGIQHHFGALEACDIIIKAAHLNGFGRMETVAAGGITRHQPVNIEMDHFDGFGFGAERADDRLQRTHPAQGSGMLRCLAPAHRFGPGKLADDGRHNIGQQFGHGASSGFHHRDIEITLFGVGLDLGLRKITQSRAFQKALDGPVRSADARAFFLLALVGLAGRQAGNVQSQTPRRRIGLRPFIHTTALDQRIGDQRLQILGRLALHAGRNFLGKEFEQKVRHEGQFPEIISITSHRQIDNKFWQPHFRHCVRQRQRIRPRLRPLRFSARPRRRLSPVRGPAGCSSAAR